MIIVGCPSSAELAKNISRKVKGAKFSLLNSKKFPDGETRLRFEKNVKGEHIVLVQSLFNPNDKIIEILFAAHTAKDLGAKKVTLVAPYLSYMRQDIRFYANDCISAKVQGELFKVFDEVITIDPHLHRIHSLNKVFKKGIRLSANSLIADYIKHHLKNPLVIGPDAESYQWADKIAEELHSHAIVLKKKRYNSRHVAIKLKNNISLKGCEVAIVDDIISTGHTMMETVKEAKKHGASKVYCICVHGLFADDAITKLKKLGAHVISTNTVPNESSKIDVSGIIAKALSK